uniref:Uncharacterized protein n=1 Tax=Anguilla anguilla TaxID=7936 RepID=A0A0E9Q2E9_ANGAN
MSPHFSALTRRYAVKNLINFNL